MGNRPLKSELQVKKLYVVPDVYYVEAFKDGEPTPTFVPVGEGIVGLDKLHQALDNYIRLHDPFEEFTYRIWKATVEQVIPNGDVRREIREKMARDRERALLSKKKRPGGVFPKPGS